MIYGPWRDTKKVQISKLGVLSSYTICVEV